MQGSDDEVIKLVETSGNLCPVHHAPSPATYYNPVAKEKWSPASLLLPGSKRCYTTGVNDLHKHKHKNKYKHKQKKNTKTNTNINTKTKTKTKTETKTKILR